MQARIEKKDQKAETLKLARQYTQLTKIEAIKITVQKYHKRLKTIGQKRV